MSQVDQAVVQTWQSLIGTHQAQATLIHLGRLKVKPIQFHLSKFWNQKTDPPNKLAPLSQSIKAILQWWQVQENLNQDTPLELPPFTHHLLTDASKKGWVAYLQDITCQGTWSQLETQFHINNLEMRVSNQPTLTSTFLLCLMSSSHQTIPLLLLTSTGGGKRTWYLLKETESLLLFVTTLNISICARCIPGRMNVIAHGLVTTPRFCRPHLPAIGLSQSRSICNNV